MEFKIISLYDIKFLMKRLKALNTWAYHIVTPKLAIVLSLFVSVYVLRSPIKPKKAIRANVWEVQESTGIRRVLPRVWLAMRRRAAKSFDCPPRQHLRIIRLVMSGRPANEPWFIIDSPAPMYSTFIWGPLHKDLCGLISENISFYAFYYTLYSFVKDKLN